MASDSSFDKQASALFNQHPQSSTSQPPAVSSIYPTTTPSGFLFAQSSPPFSLWRSVDDYQIPPPIPTHQNTSALSTAAYTTTIATTTTTTMAAANAVCPAYLTAKSSGCVFIDGQLQSGESVQNLLIHLREEIAFRDAQIIHLTEVIASLQRIVGDRNRDVDQLKSVLDQKYTPLVAIMGSGENNNNVETDHTSTSNTIGLNVAEAFMEIVEPPSRMMPPPQLTSMAPTRVKKQGVCGESVSRNGSIGFIHHEKDYASRSLIYNSITSNDFLNNLEHSQIEEIVLCMYEKRVGMNSFIIREGEPGDALYVTAEGILEVLKGEKVIGQMEVGSVFGEMALLYNCNRTASVKALTNAKFWKLDRSVYQQIMMNSSVHKHKENFQFLMSVSDFSHLSPRKLHKLADVLELIYYPGNEYIIRQGEVGETFFIIHSGLVKVTQSKQPGEAPQEIRILRAGDWFGERALYTRDRRSANVVSVPPGVHVLCLDRSNFIHLIGDLSEIKSREYADSNQCLFSQLPVTDEESSYKSMDKRASMSSQVSVEEGSVRGSVTAESGAEVTSSSFFLPALPSKRGTSSSAENDMSIGNARASAARQKIKYEDLVSVAILGVGGFGRVELVVLKQDPTKSFALKCMKKKHIVDTRQEKHIFSERNLMFEIKSPFVCHLYATYRDSKYVYMLLEACLGGEIWTVLRNRGNFDDNITRFVVASVLEAFTYLHTHNIIYRDLKPENLLLDNRGYIKLCDFGFSKKLCPGKKTWTFCGTPEYVAPEIILNKGHDHSADYWSLGILIFELLTGSPPFTGTDPMKIYSIILRGIDGIMFPPVKINRTATALIHRLCTHNPVERLGYGRGGIVDIKQHKYFQGFDWIGLCRGTLQAPILPKISGPTDVSNFDHYPDLVEVTPIELSGWDEEF